MNSYPKYGHPFEQGEIYHIYNRAIGNEDLFISPDHYKYFLDRFHFYTREILSVYAFCLLNNHFHFLVRIHNEVDSNLASEQLRRFFISYSKSFNKINNRRGSLFSKHLKSVKILTESQLLWTIYYIHRNPLHHGLTKNYKGYKWSSYRILVSDKTTKLDKPAILELFKNKRELISFHDRNIKDDTLNKRIPILES